MGIHRPTGLHLISHTLLAFNLTGIHSRKLSWHVLKKTHLLAGLGVVLWSLEPGVKLPGIAN